MKRKSSWLNVLLLIMGFTTIPFGRAKEVSYTIFSPGETQDKWFGTYYIRGGMNNDVLRVGGWGDAYYTMIKMPIHFSVSSRVIITGAKLQLYSFGSTRPTSMRKYFARDSWSESSTTDHWNVRIWDQGQIPAPPENGYYNIDITAEFNAWLSGTYPNHGIILAPENVDNRFNNFLSSENARGYGHPRIIVTYEPLPDFKLPLPGGVAWKLTVEAGGKQFDEQTELDTFHTGNSLYSLDFSPNWINLSGSGGGPATDVPIYAAAGGKIVANGYSDANGWFVTIDHDYDGDVTTGFQTKYIHLKNQGPVATGNVVAQGRQIGTMGNTGVSEGTHLHMTFYYKNAGGLMLSDYDSPYLNALRMEGRSIRNYKVGTTWNSTTHLWNPVYHYPSSNTAF